MKQIPFAAPATLALAMVFALSACDERRDDAQVDDAANPPPVATEPAPTAMPDEPMTDANAPVRISSVDLGSQVGADNRVTAPMAVYSTSDDIHASVATDGTGGTVSTVWTFEDGQVVHTEDKRVPAGAQVTDFMITNPAGWPTGSYKVEVMVDGRVVETRDYEVR